MQQVPLLRCQTQRHREPPTQTTKPGTPIVPRRSHHPGWRHAKNTSHLVRWAARPTLALSVGTGDVESVLYSAVFGFPARLETTFQTLVAATTTGPPRITPGLARHPTLLPHMPRSRHTAAHVA